MVDLLKEIRPDASRCTPLQVGEKPSQTLSRLSAARVPLRRLAVSCGLEGHGLTPVDLSRELWLRHACLRRHRFLPLWQLDGRPMRGDVGAGTAVPPSSSGAKWFRSRLRDLSSLEEPMPQPWGTLRSENVQRESPSAGWPEASCCRCCRRPVTVESLFASGLKGDAWPWIRLKPLCGHGSAARHADDPARRRS